MKLLFSFFLALFVTSLCQAQTVVIRVYEAPDYCGGKSPNKIVICEGKEYRTIELEACGMKKPEECGNLKKIAKELDSFLAQGYKILGSTAYAGNECTEVTTYILHKD